VPNAGAGDLTGPLCAPNIFRTSFTMWQSGYAMGKVALDQKKKTAVTFTWKYAGGEESVGGFKEAFEAGGGKVVKQLYLPFPQVEFQSYLTEIAATKPDVVYVFFAGGGAVKFTKDYQAAGLKDKIPLYGPGFLTDGTLEAQGTSAQGLLTTLHYADNLETPRNESFRKNFALNYKANADVYAVQGYDAAQLLGAGLTAVKGDFKQRDQMLYAMGKTVIGSPRGKFAMSAAHNPVQDIYLREAKGVNNEYRSVAVKQLADPAKGCKMSQ
jgi:branched-chain amino acid transport system substrate-binding protein